MAPGAAMDFDFEIEYAQHGFPASGGQTAVVYNGTFFNNSVLPQFGYIERRQLSDRNDRRKYGLPEIPRMAPIDDLDARANTYIVERCGLDRFRDHGIDRARPDRAGAGLSGKEWTTTRPITAAPLFPLQIGHENPAVRILAVGALGGEEGQWNDVVDRDLLRPAACVQRRSHDRIGEEVARLLHEEFLAVPVPPGAHPRVSELRGVCAEFRQHDSVFGSRSASSPTCATRTISTTCSTSPRTKSRISGGRIR